VAIVTVYGLSQIDDHDLVVVDEDGRVRTHLHDAG
jgi:uncharacterized protein (UPF0303 family)